jgi:hypothetical protein
MHIRFPEDIHEIVPVKNVGESPVFACETPVRGCPAVTDCAVSYAEHTRNQARPRRQTRRVRTIILIKTHAVRSYFVKIRRSIPRIPVTAHVVGTKRVYIKK